MRLKNLPAWQKLEKRAARMNRDEMRLENLMAREKRLEHFSLSGGGLFYDFSRQRVDEKTMSLLFELAEARGVNRQFCAMTEGEKVNKTEKRAALHTAFRDFSGKPIFADGKDVALEIAATREKIKQFADDVHQKKITGSTGKPFKHIIAVGIGGSHLGLEFVSGALEMFSQSGMKIHFLSNVDIYNFEKTVDSIDPEATLWIVISKSFKTVETLANADLAKTFMKRKVADYKKHFVAVTALKRDNDGDFDDFCKLFDLFDFIGGRYSVTSSAGGVPLSLFLGHNIFDRFLKGAGEMDMHAKRMPARKNIPLVAALISIWNSAFLKYDACGIIPYSTPLSGLCAHIRQLHMESVGKSADIDGQLMDAPTGTLIFGESGTNAQHSFFQFAHQGKPFPIEFIGIIKSCRKKYRGSHNGISNHQELWANLIAQPLALALGSRGDDPAKFFPGNRPSSTLVMDELTPENIGRLLSFYEAKTVYEGFIWGVNPFDQFGVELGKKIAIEIRDKIKKRNGEKKGENSKKGSIEQFYIDMLFNRDF